MQKKIKKPDGKVFLLGLFFLTAGCAHSPRSLHESQGDSLDALAETPLPKTLTEVLQQDVTGSTIGSPSKTLVTRNGEIFVAGVRLKNSTFDLPVTINARVEYWIEYFRGRGRKHFQKYLERSEFFIPYIVPLLKKEGLPEDLVYLAMIESGFNNFARSHAKAVGPWQFISATGRRYGLNVDWWVDQRRDIEKSTLAAARFLGDLYGMFQSWELASAAYNAGPNKIAKAIKRYGTKDFWVISQHRYLRPETRDYVPKIFAAAILAKNRAQFGFAESTLKPGAGEVVAGDGEVVKVVKSDKPIDDDATELNDVLAERGVDSFEDHEDDINVSQASTRFVSAYEPGEGIPQPLSDSGSLPLARPVQTPHMTKQGQVSGDELAVFEVQSPADLLKIARAAGLSYQTVKSLNPEVLRWCTPPKTKNYRIKLPVSVKDKFLSTYNHDAYPRQIQFMTYKAKRGDNLGKVARRFGIKVDPIADLNGLSERSFIKNGSMVLLPVPNDRSRTFASLEVRDPPEVRRSKRGRRHKSYRVSYKRREAARTLPRHSNDS